MYNKLPAKLKWNAQLIKTISASSPPGKTRYSSSDLGLFLHLPFPTGPPLVDFNMICWEVYNIFVGQFSPCSGIWKFHLFIQSWEIFGEALRLHCWCPKACSDHWEVGAASKLGHCSNWATHFASLSLSFPVCGTSGIAHVLVRKEIGQVLEVEGHLGLFNGSSRMPVPPAVWTPVCEVLLCWSAHPLLCYSTSIWCLSVYWTWDLMNATTRRGSPLPAVPLALV